MHFSLLGDWLLRREPRVTRTCNRGPFLCLQPPSCSPVEEVNLADRAGFSEGEAKTKKTSTAGGVKNTRRRTAKTPERSEERLDKPAAKLRCPDVGESVLPCPAETAADMSDQQLDCALDLMRRLPPQQIEKNLSDLIDLVPSLCEDLLSSVDQPLKIARDKVVGKDYLLCDYNRDGDSYRSPWSNKYEPPIEDGAMPSARLRKLEVEANNAFDQYRDLYFEGGVSSVYLWDLDHGFAGVILIKKAGDGSKKIKGCWDSIHVVEVQEKSSGRTAHYKLTSTVMLWLQTTKTGSGTMNLGGSLTRQMEKDETVGESSPHIANIGRLVEDMENKIRSTLNEIYFGKTKDIVNGLRSVQTLADKSKQEALKYDLVEALKRKQNI
ncbi:F-actin-capping protein subunit beta isoform X2 [Paralichthys olivaceus]|uniref:F-actin-capping protein subunit beta isoform X2 n=1 Tax=Paralichthys olivaceus TaxID=8255 RepID=UPI00097E1150|nr:PREDICTED: F-actin-capping protein subunit beta isoform X2 [Paralichthys olivaceus]